MILYKFFNRGSKASRKPSPSNINPKTASKMKKPGQSEAQGAIPKYNRPSLISFPQSIILVSLKPKNANPDNPKITPPMSKVTEIIIG